VTPRGRIGVRGQENSYHAPLATSRGRTHRDSGLAAAFLSDRLQSGVERAGSLATEDAPQ